MKRSELSEIKRIVEETLKRMGNRLVKIILFGSQARGHTSERSDYDLLIVLEERMSIHRKMEVSKKLRVALSMFAVDIIIKSVSEVEEQKELIGTVVREALKEGVSL